MSSASKDTILFIERVDDYCLIYYEDQHTEIYDISLLKLIKTIRKNSRPHTGKRRYKMPFQFGDILLAPTKSIKDKDCAYYNILKIDEHNPYFYQLLAERGLLEMAKKQFLKQKEIDLDNQ